MRKTNTGEGERKSKATYADMKLYEEIILLDNFFDGKYCIENVIPYYEPLILAKKRGRHLYWTNFNLPFDLGDRKADNFIYSKVKELIEFHDYDFTKYKGKQRIDKISRNLVDYEAGKTIFQTALGLQKENKTNQLELL
jgi:DNA (cytosine-5)-methyltransferase 1